MTAKLLPFRRAPVAAAPISDEGLLAGCAMGDRAALGLLFDRHRAAVHRFLSRLGPRHPSDVDDLVQLTFLEAHRSAPSFRAQSSVSTWLMAVAVNVARHHARAEGRRRIAMQALPSQTGDAAPPDDEAERRRRAERLRDVMGGLEERLRTPFVMCDLEGIPYEEVAAALGIPIGSLWRRLHDARTRLRAVLEEEL